MKFKQITSPPIKKPANVSDEQWKTALDIYSTAKAMGDAYPELTVAQAALETGWFKSLSGNYNYFGQKAGKNQPSVALKTKEQGANGLYSTTANFRTYNTIQESIGDRINKWGSKYKDAKDVNEALTIVVDNGYATAKDYKSSVGNILSSITGNKIVTNNQVKTVTQEKTESVALPTLPTGSVALNSSTAKYQEPKMESNEVQAAKQEISEKSFLSDLGSILSQQPAQKAFQTEQFAIDPSFYNYIDEENY